MVRYLQLMKLDIPCLHDVRVFLMKLLKKFDIQILHELEVSSIDTLNLSSYAYEELKFKVSASDTSNS